MGGIKVQTYVVKSWRGMVGWRVVFGLGLVVGD